MRQVRTAGTPVPRDSSEVDKFSSRRLIDGDACADRIDRDPGGALAFARAACDGTFAAPVATGDSLPGGDAGCGCTHDRPAAPLALLTLLSLRRRRARAS